MIGTMAVLVGLWSAPALAQDTPVPGTATQDAAGEDRADGDGSNVPGATAVGFGIGIVAPAGSWAPNTASVRVRVADGVALEPRALVYLGNDREVAVAGDDETVSAVRIGSVNVGLDVRGTVATRDNVELIALGGGSILLQSTTNDPDGDDNNSTTSATRASLVWGLGANWWLHRSFCLSADVRNPLLSLNLDRQRSEAVDDAYTGGSNMDISLAFAPSVRVMGHIVF